jgi:hypothetical protein
MEFEITLERIATPKIAIDLCAGVGSVCENCSCQTGRKLPMVAAAGIYAIALRVNPKTLRLEPARGGPVNTLFLAGIRSGSG